MIPYMGNKKGDSFTATTNVTAICRCTFSVRVFLLHAELRRSNIDASEEAVKALEKIVRQIRKSWHQVKILIRSDSGFVREEILAWCEANGVDYMLGLAKDP